LQGIWLKTERETAIAMFPTHSQQFAARRQHVNLGGFLGQALCEWGDCVDQMLTTVKNDEQLFGADRVKQLGGCVHRFQGKPQRGPDSSRNVTRVCQVSQVDKMDRAELLRHGVTDGDRNGRLANSTGTNMANPILDVVENRVSPDHLHGLRGQLDLASAMIASVGCTIFETRDLANEPLIKKRMTLSRNQCPF
jgi:hypothetical protein